jgi:hypothetical protein
MALPRQRLPRGPTGLDTGRGTRRVIAIGASEPTANQTRKILKSCPDKAGGHFGASVPGALDRISA